MLSFDMTSSANAQRLKGSPSRYRPCSCLIFLRTVTHSAMRTGPRSCSSPHTNTTSGQTRTSLTRLRNSACPPGQIASFAGE